MIYRIITTFNRTIDVHNWTNFFRIALINPADVAHVLFKSIVYIFGIDFFYVIRQR